MTDQSTIFAPRNHAAGPDPAVRYSVPWVPAWYRDAKFGIFVHWGIYSVPAFAVVRDHHEPLPEAEAFRLHPYAEWYANTLLIPDSPTRIEHDRRYGPGVSYEDLADRWRAEHYRPEQWADLFAEAGARFVVPTTKHHDGFALWDTETTRFSAAHRGPGRDLIAPLAAAVRARGLRLGLYYSGALDWHARPYGAITSTDDLFTRRDSGRAFADYCLAQLRELVAAHRPELLWNDIDWPDAGKGSGPDDLAAFFAEYYRQVPQGLVNDRWGVPHAGYRTVEYAASHQWSDEPWEACRGLAQSFGYNAQESEQDVASVAELVQLLVDVVARNGTLLLNVGPRADGTIPEVYAQRLQGLGRWLRRYQAAIYGTRGVRLAKGLATTDGARTYLFLPPGRSELPAEVADLGGSARLLDGGEPVPVEDGHLVLPDRLADHHPDVPLHVVALS